MADTYALRPLTTADYDAVLDLWRNTEGICLNESDTRDAIASFLQRNPRLSTVACAPDGVIVGAVLCGHDGRRGYLHHLAVTPTHRKKGLGRALVNACLEQLAALGIPKCNIFLLADNADGRVFWLHEGWATRDDLVVVQKPLFADGTCSCG